MFPYSNYLIVQTKFAKLLKKKTTNPSGYYEICYHEKCFWVRKGWEMPFESNQEGLLNGRNVA